MEKTYKVNIFQCGILYFPLVLLAGIIIYEGYFVLVDFSNSSVQITGVATVLFVLFLFSRTYTVEKMLINEDSLLVQSLLKKRIVKFNDILSFNVRVGNRGFIILKYKTGSLFFLRGMSGIAEVIEKAKETNPEIEIIKDRELFTNG